MIQAKIINRINFPEIKLQSTLEEIAEKIIIRDLITNIGTSKSVAGGNLPPNEPATKKRKGGKPPLVDTGTLQNSFYWKSVGKDKVIVSIDPIRKKIGEYLQAGVGNMNKRYIFFGISNETYKRAIDYAAKKVKELTKNGTRK